MTIDNQNHLSILHCTAVFSQKKNSYCSFWVSSDSEILTYANSAEHRWCKYNLVCLLMVKQHTFKRLFSTKSVKILFQRRYNFWICSSDVSPQEFCHYHVQVWRFGKFLFFFFSWYLYGIFLYILDIQVM